MPKGPAPSDSNNSKCGRLDPIRVHGQPQGRVLVFQAHALDRLDLSTIFGSCLDNISRVSTDEERYTNFGVEYQSISTPALISGALSTWPAMERWSLESFAADFGHQKIICDHRFGIRMRFDDFREYMALQADSGWQASFWAAVTW